MVKCLNYSDKNIFFLSKWINNEISKIYWNQIKKEGLLLQNKKLPNLFSMFFKTRTVEIENKHILTEWN